MLAQVKLPQKLLERVRLSLLMGYLLENFIAEALNEKVVAAYMADFREAHMQVVETVLRSPENLRTIMGAVVDRNEKLAQFLLECLYVVSDREETTKGVLIVFLKTHADRIVARRICELEFENAECNSRLNIKLTLKANRSKFTFCLLQILGRLLHRHQPVALTNFTREALASGDPDPDKIIGNLMLLVCQNTLLNFKIEAMNVLSQLLDIMRKSSSRRTSPDGQLKSADSFENTVFDHRCVNLIKKLNLSHCLSYFQLLDLFVQNRAAGILTQLFSQTDLTEALIQVSSPSRINKSRLAIALGILRVIYCSKYREHFDIKSNLVSIKQLMLKFDVRSSRSDNVISAAFNSLCFDLSSSIADRQCQDSMQV